MAANGTGAVAFIDDATADGSSKINSEVYVNVVFCLDSAKTAGLIAWYFTMQNNSEKLTVKASKDLIQAKQKNKKKSLLQWVSVL